MPKTKHKPAVQTFPGDLRPANAQYNANPGRPLDLSKLQPGDPFLPYAASGSGVQFTYYDSTGVVTNVKANVARIDVVVRAQTAAPVALTGGTKSYVRDSLAFSISLRNRQ